MRRSLGRLGLGAAWRLAQSWWQQSAPNPLAGVWRSLGYAADYFRYRRRDDNTAYQWGFRRLSPCLNDRTETTPLDPTYFYQDAWGAGKVFKARPKRHVDVGSSAKTLGILSQFVPVTMVDIRPLEVSLPGLDFIKGDILALPFKSGSIRSLSSLCVIEHIGLGRYGDPLDPWGSEKAAAELTRVLAKGGDLYLSVPVDAESGIYFNAHRAFGRDHALSLFKGLQLLEESYIYGTRLQKAYDPGQGFGTGLFHFRKKR